MNTDTPRLRTAVANALTEMDTRSFLWLINSRLQPNLAEIAKRVSRSGDGYLQIALPMALVVLGIEQADVFLLATLSAFVLWMPIYWVLKNSLKRRRPPQALPNFRSLIIASDEFSFPSGHTAAAFILASLGLMCFGAIAMPLLIWACAVGASRVILGVHFPGDILAGATFGVAIASLSGLLLGA